MKYDLAVGARSQLHANGRIVDRQGLAVDRGGDDLVFGESAGLEIEGSRFGRIGIDETNRGRLGIKLLDQRGHIPRQTGALAAGSK